MKNKSNVRESNFELLRIIAIVLVIMHHYSVHNNLWGGVDFFNINKYFGLATFSVGKIGVNLFVLIMGYFNISKEFKIKRVIKVVLQMFFYSILIYLLFVLLNKAVFNPTDLLLNFFPLAFNRYWFVCSYILLYLISPLLNNYFDSIDKEQYKKIIKYGFIIFVMYYSLMYNQMLMRISNDYPMSNVLFFAYLYIVGGYVSKYKIKWLEKKKNNNLMIIVTCLTLFIGLIISELLKKYGIFSDSLYYYISQNSIFIFPLSFLVFYRFKNINIKSKKINFIASCSFGVYLLQSHILFEHYLYTDLLKTNNYISSPYLIIHLIISILIIYVSAIIIELVRKNTFEKMVFWLVDNFSKKRRKNEV